MVQQPVCVEVFIDRAEHRRVLQGSSCSTDSRDGVDDHTDRVDHPCLDQRCERKGCRRHVAARRSHQRGFFQVFAVQFRQTEHRGRQQLRLVVVESVPLRVQRSVLQSERGRQIDEAANLAVQLRGEGHRCLVGQAEEHDVEPLCLCRVELVEHQVGVPRGQARVHPAGQRAGLTVAARVDHVELRMLGTQPQELCSGVTRCADDADSLHDV